MWYLDKKWILEHCGKDGKDVRWLDRAMKRGEVIHDVDMGYITVVDYIWELEEEIKELKKSDKEKEVEEVMKDMDLWSELEEAKAQWEYYENLYNEEREDKQERIRRCFRWIKQIKPSADWEEFRDWVMSDEEL